MRTDISPLTLETLATRLEELEHEHTRKVTDLEAANAALREEVAMLRSDQMCPPGQAPRPASPSRAARTSRRRVLQAAAMAAASAGAGALLTTRDAQAMPADNIGTFSSSVGGTPAVSATGTNGAFGAYANSDSGFGLYVTSNSNYAISAFSNSAYAVQGLTETSNGVVGGALAGAGYGVWGLNEANNANGIGVVGESTNGLGNPGPGTGVKGISGTGQGVVGTSDSNYGVLGLSTNGFAVRGISTNSYGVVGNSGSDTGVYGVGPSHGVVGNSSSGAGGAFSGGRVPLYLQPAGGPAGAPSSGLHFAGDIFVDSLAVFWLCTATGTPGTWVRLAGVANGTNGGATTFLSTPIRLVDTRGNGAPITNGGVPLAGGGTLVVQVTGTSVGGVSVPAGASAVVGNLTAVPSANGDLTIWEDGIARPNVSNLNYTTGINVANFVMAALSPAGKVDIFSHVGSTHVILDVTGYML